MAHIGHPILGDTLYPIPAQYTALISASDLTIGTSLKSADCSSASASASAGAESSANAGLSPSAHDSGSYSDVDAASAAPAVPAVPVLTAASAPATPTPRVDRAYPRLCLHALQLTFRHPTSHQQITLSALSTEAAPQPMPSTVPADHLATTASLLRNPTCPPAVTLPSVASAAAVAAISNV